MINENRLVAHAWIFDVDGVLTHPSEKKVTKQELFFQLIKRLEAGEPVILNSGRAVDFMLKNILDPVERLVEDKKFLKNLFAVGEKGAVSVLYNDNKERTEYIDRSIIVPQELQNEARKLVEEKFSDIAFYDLTKKTMISIEMHDGLSVDEFRKRQGELGKKLSELLEQHGLTAKYRVELTRIAIDVENKHVGKGLGVQRALQWLSEQKIKPEKFIAFGDSPSDAAMAAELQERGLPVEFVFVGEKDLLADQKFDFHITYTKGQCEEGTVEYLKGLE
ncbi:MAG: HAD hydrolase family protein [Patescibacteria group bacterium]